MCPKDVDRIANSVDPDQTAPGSTLFAQTCLPENLGSLWGTASNHLAMAICHVPI